MSEATVTINNSLLLGLIMKTNLEQKIHKKRWILHQTQEI